MAKFVAFCLFVFFGAVGIVYLSVTSPIVAEILNSDVVQFLSGFVTW